MGWGSLRRHGKRVVLFLCKRDGARGGVATHFSSEARREGG